MATRKHRQINLPAPYLKRVWIDKDRVQDPDAYPFCLPFLRDGLDLGFDHAITIIVGENGTGKSTLLEGIAALAGYDEAGGGKGYMPVRSRPRGRSHGRAVIDRAARRAGCRRSPPDGSSAPKASSRSHATSIRPPSIAGGAPPDFLSHSHGEGFLRFFEERCQRQGIFIFDEPESALSPSRQVEFLKLLRKMDEFGICQVIMATHAPILMAYPSARLLRISHAGIRPTAMEETEHYRLMQEFFSDPAAFLRAKLTPQSYGRPMGRPRSSPRARYAVHKRSRARLSTDNQGIT